MLALTLSETIKQYDERLQQVDTGTPFHSVSLTRTHTPPLR